MKEQAAELRRRFEEKKNLVQRGLQELGETHRDLLARGECPCATGGRCGLSETIERGAEVFSDDPMGAARGSC